MELTLKKAHELSRLAIEAANKRQAPTAVTVSAFADMGPVSKTSPRSMVVAGRGKVLEAAREAVDLLTVGYALRKRLGAANARGGIGDRLADIAFEEAAIKRLDKTLGAAAEDPDDLDGLLAAGRDEEADTDFSAVEAKLRALRAAHEAPGGAPRGLSGRTPDSVALPVLDRAAREAFKAEVAARRRRIRALREECQAANFTLRVALEDHEAAVLRKHGILD